MNTSKVVFVGREDTGKTSLIYRIVKGTYSKLVSSTIGAAFLAHNRVIEGKRVKIGLWDTAGQERFSSMIPIFTRNAAIACICISPSNRIADNLETLNKYGTMMRELDEDMIVLVILTKYDLEEVQSANIRELETLCTIEGYNLFKTSSVTGEGINELSDEIYKCAIVDQGRSGEISEFELTSTTRVGLIPCCIMESNPLERS